jgi:hypothetical protein
MTLSRTVCLLAAGVAVAGLVHADDRGRDRLEARLKSYQEVPAVVSPASGRFKATIDKASGTLAYELSYGGLRGDVLMAHIHVAQRGVNGGIVVWLCQTAARPSPVASTPPCPQSGTVCGVVSSADVQAVAAQGVDANNFGQMLDAVRAGAAYVNVHSARFPGGEIRGQLKDED